LLLRLIRPNGACVVLQSVFDRQFKQLQLLDPECIGLMPGNFRAQFAVYPLVILHQAKRRNSHDIILIEHS
jgi:hypothetical protein